MYKQAELLAQYGDTVKKAPVATKFKKVWARPAIGGEVIVTTTNDGKETQNTANAGDMVVWNQTMAGEQYVIREAKFPKLYTETPVVTTEAGYEWRQYSPLGRVHALEVTDKNNPNTFEAPWGESMKCVVGDFLCCPVGANEIYRIARQEFFETYQFESKSLTQEEMLAQYGDIIMAGPIASKFRPVWAREAVKGEHIVVITSDGPETEQTAQDDEIVIKNLTDASEEYIVQGFKFRKRYVKITTPEINWEQKGKPAWSMYMPIGKVYTLEVTAENNPNPFYARWGELMQCKVGDFLAIPVDTPNEIYRIARQEFFETYKF